LSDPKVIKNGFFKANTFKVTIRLKAKGWKAYRTYEDFKWLHNSLKSRFPANYVVELPVIEASDETREADVFLLTSYLNHILRSPDLLFSPELVEFLKLSEKDLANAKEVPSWVTRNLCSHISRSQEISSTSTKTSRSTRCQLRRAS
jgi:hypothetical protein